MKQMIHHLHTSVQHLQKERNPRKTSTWLREKGVALGSPLLSVLANLHYIMATLMKLMLVMGGAAVISQTPESPWIRRGLLALAVLTASFTLFHVLSHKYERRMLLFRCASLLFTVGMIIWSITTFGL